MILGASLSPFVTVLTTLVLLFEESVTSYIYLLLKKIVVYKLFVARSMLITALIMALTLDSITYKYFWVTLIYSSISIRQRKQIENTRVVK